MEDNESIMKQLMEVAPECAASLQATYTDTWSTGEVEQSLRRATSEMAVDTPSDEPEH